MLRNPFLFHKMQHFFWCSKNNLYIRREFIEKHKQWHLTVFILATLFISSLVEVRIVLWLFEKYKRQIKLIYNPDANQDFFLNI